MASPTVADGGRRLGAPGWVALAVVLALAAAVVADAEWWPVSSMRLFSGRRTAELVSWRAVAELEGSSPDQTIDFATLGRSYRGAHWLIPRLVGRSPAGRDAVCADWAAAVEAHEGVRVASIRVERVRGHLEPHGRGVVADATRVLFRCAGTGP